MMESEFVHRAQLQRTVVVGNGGSGKSSLARSIAELIRAPAIDLDHIHWQGEAYGSRQDESVAKRLVAEVAAKPAWVIEGVYGWLVRLALPSATILIWLDLPWQDCRAGLMARGLRRGMTSADHAALVTWAAEYWTRDSSSSYYGHLRLFDCPKLRFTTRSQVEQFASDIAI
jgi:adenylate kinase family enzyme